MKLADLLTIKQARDELDPRREKPEPQQGNITEEKPHQSLACTIITVETDNINSRAGALRAVSLASTEELDQRRSTTHGKEAAYACILFSFFGQQENSMRIRKGKT